MGCDIHAFLEIRHFKYDDTERTNGVWVNADKWSVDSYHELYPEDGQARMGIDYKDRIYSGRNYCLFAVLANVRNYWDMKPISEPKGMPEDVSKQVKKECENWDCDGHSHSYLTLAEILAYDGWNLPDEGADFALNEEYAKKLEKEYGGNHIETIPQNIGFKVRYKTNVKELCGDFYTKTIERMKSHLKEDRTTSDDIRIVFWFDN